MPETVTVDRPPVVTVSASALALHLDCSRTYISKLEAEGVIQRQGDGFPLDQSRLGMLIKGHQRIDVELKHRRKLFFSNVGALVRIHCITIDHVAHKITLAVDGFSRESSSQHTA